MQFKDYTKEEQDLIITYMDTILQDMISNRNHIPISHIAKVIQEFYDSFPGLHEFRLRELYEAFPDGNVFSTYMPNSEINYANIPDKCIHAKVIDINVKEKNNENN